MCGGGRQGKHSIGQAFEELVLKVVKSFSVSTLQTAPCGMWAAITREPPHPAVGAGAAWYELWVRQLGAA